MLILVSACFEAHNKFVKLTSSGIDVIKFDKMFYRKDIAHRAFKPTTETLEALTYASAGVSIEGGNEFVERIKTVSSFRYQKTSADSRLTLFFRPLHQPSDQGPMLRSVALEAKLIWRRLDTRVLPFW